jgi:hypothetical protein
MMPHEHFAETIGGLRCKVLVLGPQKMSNLICKAPLFLSNELEHYLHKGKNLLENNTLLCPYSLKSLRQKDAVVVVVHLQLKHE